MDNKMFIYQFETSQKLTDYQLEFLNEHLRGLPSLYRSLNDIPEVVTDIDLQQDK